MEKCLGEMDSSALRDGKHTLAGPPGRADVLYCIATSCWKSHRSRLTCSTGDSAWFRVSFVHQRVGILLSSNAWYWNPSSVPRHPPSSVIPNTVWVFFSASAGTANLSSPLKKMGVLAQPDNLRRNMN